MLEETEYRFTNYWEPEDEDNIYNPEDLEYGQEQDYYYDPLEEMRNCRNWVGYRLTPRENGKNSKMPVNPHDGTNAKANDPATWGTYYEASQAVQKYNLNGVGFEFGAQFQGYIGVDLDDVILENGNLKPFAQEIVDTLDSYTEASPSGKGIHIICKSQTGMESWGYSKLSHRDDNIGLEMYDSKRFFTITENVYGIGKYVNDRTSQLQKVYEKYLNKLPASVPINSIPTASYSAFPTPSVETLSTLVPAEDKELWGKMFSSQNGDKIRSLFNGDTSSYNYDDSRADLALCNYLVYWCNKDLIRIDRMFRQSKLMRPKWDSGNSPTYGERTIQTALGQNSFSLPPVPPLSPLNTIPATSSSQISLPVVNNHQDDDDITIAGYLDGLFDDDVKKFHTTSNLKTGFSNIDAITSLYPGLYLLGAVPGLGKTTFASQLADNLSKAGEHVLFFSLEQKRLELVSKGLSRLTVRNNQGVLQGLTAIQIRDLGKNHPSVREAIEKYKKFSVHERFISKNFSNFDFIKNKILNYISANKVRPVVFVDYLQIIQPSEINKNTTKDVIDSHVRDFKMLQVQNDLVLVLISSLNRANYMAPIDYESFKETGALEYTSDVVWGLQLQIMNDEAISGKKESVTEKREKIKAAKSQIPRKLELVCIKNRFGQNYTCHFDYYAQYDLFVAQNVQNNSQLLNIMPVQTIAHI